MHPEQTYSCINILLHTEQPGYLAPKANILLHPEQPDSGTQSNHTLTPLATRLAPRLLHLEQPLHMEQPDSCTQSNQTLAPRAHRLLHREQQDSLLHRSIRLYCTQSNQTLAPRAIIAHGATRLLHLEQPNSCTQSNQTLIQNTYTLAQGATRLSWTQVNQTLLHTEQPDSKDFLASGAI